MNSMSQLNVTYTQWLNMRTFLGGTVTSYYVQDSQDYILVLVDLSRKFITICSLRNGNPSGPANIADFESNYKATAIAQSTIDDCVAAAVIG